MKVLGHTFKIVFLLILLGFLLKSLMADETFIAIGDFLHIAIPSIGVVMSLFYKDWDGIKQFLWTFILTALITHGIKLTTRDMLITIRPYGGKDSFPSGHTSSAFQGALFVRKRYHKKWGVFMIGLASLTAYSRIYGQYHHWRDIIVGFIIAFLVNKIFVTLWKKSN